MYDLQYLQDSPSQPQRADLPCLRGPYRRTSRRPRWATKVALYASLGAACIGIAALESDGIMGDWAIFLTCAGLLALALWAGKGE